MEKFAALLEQEIFYLEAEMQQLKPSGWPVPPLAESYLQSEVLGALSGAWDELSEVYCQAGIKALEDHLYGEEKISHLYV